MPHLSALIHTTLAVCAVAVVASACCGAPAREPVLPGAPASTRMTAGVREALARLKEGGWDAKRRVVVVDVAYQRLLVLAGGGVEHAWRVSTSKYGVGSEPGSYRTPLGLHRIWRKSGAAARPGQPLKHGEPSDRADPEESVGRVFICTRALMLEGLEKSNSTSRKRGIWIHGTSAEDRIGRPASIGCVRMRNVDVISLFDSVPEGTLVYVTDKG
jgi:lipoprotein-anchoring transpeptidase ErfK/SrfK